MRVVHVQQAIEAATAVEGIVVLKADGTRQGYRREAAQAGGPIVWCDAPGHRVGHDLALILDELAAHYEQPVEVGLDEAVQRG